MGRSIGIPSRPGVLRWKASGGGRIVHTHTDRAGMAERRRCSASREGKVMLSCWISEELRLELDRLWADRGLRPHGRTQRGMEEMIAAYLRANRPE